MHPEPTPKKKETGAARVRRLSRDSLESWVESRVRPRREKRERALERTGATAAKALDCSRPSSEKMPSDRAELVVSIASRARLSLSLSRWIESRVRPLR